MQCTTVLTAAILCTVVSGQEYAGSAQCGCLEVPATSTRRRDKFCRPHLTDPAERRRYRSCVCRLGLVRNSWGDCITRQECTSCKCFPDRDFNVCGRECPLVCNEPMSRSCSKSCAFGCDCVSGFVRNSRHRGRCVKATKCGFTCPQFSSFQFCSSTCRPKCGRRPRRSCVTRCTRGDCVCNDGYAEVEHNGDTICVPQEQCSQYVPVAPPMMPGGHRNISSGGPVFVPGSPTMPVNPVVVTGGAATPSVPSSVGINNNVGAGGSSGTTVFVPVVTSTPVISGVATGGTAGTPTLGSVGMNGTISAGISSGGIVFVPGASSTSGNPAFGTGGAAGMPIPGSIANNGASPTSSVTTGGMGGSAPIVGGGNQTGSFGTSGISPISGGTGLGSVGTYPPGGVAARPPGAIYTHGRPSGGTNGFGTVSVGMSGNSIGPDDSMQSGEDTRVDPSGIPLYQGEGQPSGGQGAAVTTPSNGRNGNSGASLVGSGLHPGGIRATQIGNFGKSTVGIGGGFPGHSGVGSSFPTTPGTTIEDTRTSGTVISRPGIPSVGSAGIPRQTTPVSAIPSDPGIVQPIRPPNLASTVSSGTTVSVVTSGAAVTVGHLPSVTPAGAVTVSNGMNSNAGLTTAIPTTSMVTIGSKIQPGGTSALSGSSLGNNLPGMIGNSKANAPSLPPAGPSGTIITVPTGNPSLISVVGLSPQSSGRGSVSVSSTISSGATNVVPTGVPATGGTTSGMPIVGVTTTGRLPVTSANVGTVSLPSSEASLVAASRGVNEGSSFGLNTVSGLSIRTQPGVISPVSSSTATSGTAVVIGDVLGKHAAIPTTITATRAR